MPSNKTLAIDFHSSYPEITGLVQDSSPSSNVRFIAIKTTAIKTSRAIKVSSCFQLLCAHLGYTLVIHTWIFENMAPEILPCVTFSCEILFIYLFFALFF